MADRGPVERGPGTGLPARPSPLFREALRRWDGIDRQWKEATSEIGRVEKAVQESLDHARKNRPEHLATVQVGGAQAEKLAFDAVVDFLDTLRVRRFNLRSAVRGAGAAATELADIVSNDRVLEEQSRRRLQERLDKAMEKARPEWLFARQDSRASLHGPRVPKAPRKARGTVAATRRRQARTSRPGRTHS
ncbi:hypothetical protein ACIBFB_07140 [Nocardiopsis sp. NPDC050513]|uniref:hypothetical protein n=1 Tax=Nocardiopsis sp. NPDC050513 TaxID=3364338 RepID=UPI0037AFC348